MTPSSNVNAYLEALVHSRQLQKQVVFRSLLPSIPPMWSKTEYDGPPEIRKTLKAQGIDRLYRHQTEAIELIEKGRHVIVATPTSSGKTLVYNLPVLQRIAADRNDLGGIATVYHPQVKGSAVFLYDGVAGGAGLTRQAFERVQHLLEYTLDAIQGCPCERGCPSCVHSPKCGSGNRPIDKAAAIFILNRLKKGTVAQKSASTVRQAVPPKTQPAAADKKSSSTLDYGVFDLETQHSAAEVGGWHRAHLMKISCAVLYDSRQQRFIDFTENQIPDFIRRLREFDRIVGFNTIRFDYQVLKGYSNFDFNKLNNLDILQEVKKYLGFRLSLAHLAEITLGESKSADGLQALRWWQQGRIKEIIEYCRQDVRITRDLYRYGRKHRHLLFRNRTGQILRIPVAW